MECPGCGKELLSEEFGGVSVFECQDGCHGIYFDIDELALLEEDRHTSASLLARALSMGREPGRRSGPGPCPRCGLTMHEHSFESPGQANIDECYGCGGFFLDSGELGALRDGPMSAAESEAYVAQLVDNPPQQDLYHAEMLEPDAERAEAIRRLALFLRTAAEPGSEDKLAS